MVFIAWTKVKIHFLRICFLFLDAADLTISFTWRFLYDIMRDYKGMEIEEKFDFSRTKLSEITHCLTTKVVFLLITISRLILNGIPQKFLHNIHTIRKKYWYNFCVHISLGFAAILFFQSSFDSHISASVAWNRSKIYMEYTHSKKWHWYNFCNFTSLGALQLRFFENSSDSHISAYSEWNWANIFTKDTSY